MPPMVRETPEGNPLENVVSLEVVALIVVPLVVIPLLFVGLLALIRKRAAARRGEPLGWKTSVQFRQPRRPERS